MNEKVVRRTTTIALGTVCIVLVAGFVGSVSYLTSQIVGKDNTLGARDTQISNLQSWLDGNQTYYQSQMSSKDVEVTSLTAQIASLRADPTFRIAHTVVNITWSGSAEMDARIVSEPYVGFACGGFGKAAIYCKPLSSNFGDSDYAVVDIQGIRWSLDDQVWIGNKQNHFASFRMFGSHATVVAGDNQVIDVAGPVAYPWFHVVESNTFGEHWVQFELYMYLRNY